MPHLGNRISIIVTHDLSFVNILLLLFVIMAKMGKVSLSYSTCKFWYHPAQSCSGTPPSKAWHAKLVSLVERMLELHKRPTAQLPQEKESLQREIESTDVMIDMLVYELSHKGMIYGLTEEEIRIVES